MKSIIMKVVHPGKSHILLNSSIQQVDSVHNVPNIFSLTEELFETAFDSELNIEENIS